MLARVVLTVAAISVLPACPSPSPPPPAPSASGTGVLVDPDGAPVAVAASYQGHVMVPDEELPPRVVRDRAAFDAFVSLIPKERIQKKQPAPPSDDPLLSSPPIDFSRQMLLVAFRTTTMYVHPELERPRMEGGKLVVDVAHPPLDDAAHPAAMHGVGTYCAIVVRAFDGEVEFRGPAK